MNDVYKNTMSEKRLNEKILARPLNTILKSHSLSSYREYVNLPKLVHSRDILVNNIDNFDGREVWKSMITIPMDQGSCGSCWAFASCSCLSDRFNIHSRGKINIRLSPVKLILCNWMGGELTNPNPEDDVRATEKINRIAIKESACYGNSLVDAFRYLYLIGTVETSCIPVNNIEGVTNVKTKRVKEMGSFDNKDLTQLSQFDDSSKLPLCSNISGYLFDMCSDNWINSYTGEEHGTPSRFYRVYKFYTIDADELLIRDNIYKWGPVCSGIEIYPDFYSFDFKNNVYKWNRSGESIGGHAVVIVGWGVDKKYGSYWIVKNSWGQKWGDNGYFRISRGTNECGIEENIIAPIPDFFYDKYIPRFPSTMLSEINKELDVQKQKISIELRNVISGGIDPSTGFSRRIPILFPWLDLSPPIVHSELPDWTLFVAARDSLQTNTTPSIILKRKTYTTYLSTKIGLFLIILGLFLIIVGKISRRNLKNKFIS